MYLIANVSAREFLQVVRLVLCCPHLVNMTHGARSTSLSSSKCDGNFRSAGNMEIHSRTLFVSKDGGSPEAAGREPAGLSWGQQTGGDGPVWWNTRFALASFWVGGTVLKVS